MSLFGYLYSKAIAESRRITLSFLEPNPDATFLDLGCGDGEFTLEVAARIGARRICTIEIVEEEFNH